VAEFVNTQQGAPFSPYDLVRAVTTDAAAVVGWAEHLGQIRSGMMADLLVIAGTSAADPYTHLIAATEPAVRLVIVHGLARYGDPALVKKVHAGPDGVRA
jgi:5-methylthioadenosine/S-adenosylhomocysteine deaminase